MSGWETAGAAVGIAGGCLAILGAMCAAAVKGVRLIGRIVRFLDQWLGHGEGPERVPGVIERVEQLDARSRKIEAQVFPNGGSSLRDAVEAVREQLGEHLQASSGGLVRVEVIPGKADNG